MRVFVDTNVLVYARDPSEADKHRRARGWMEALWRGDSGCLSAQVLSEFYVTVTRKLRPGMDKDAARADIRDLQTWRFVAIDGEVIEQAFAVQDRYGLSWWDSLIVGAARQGGCDVLLSEDLQHDQDLGGVRVVDPFAVGPQELLSGEG